MPANIFQAYLQPTGQYGKEIFKLCVEGVIGGLPVLHHGEPHNSSTPPWRATQFQYSTMENHTMALSQIISLTRGVLDFHSNRAAKRRGVARHTPGTIINFALEDEDWILPLACSSFFLQFI